MSVTLVTTVRAVDEHRARNLEYTLRWYTQMPDWELLVVEQDAAPSLDSSGWSPQVRHVFVPNPGPFNKSWGMNVGALLASHPLLYLCDADLLVPQSALETGTSLCRNRVVAVNPYGKLAELAQDETQALLETAGTPDFSDPRASRTRGKGEQLPYCGGAFFIRQSVFRQIGGFDERYLGWGGEDDALGIKLAAFTTDLGTVDRQTAVHLWHPRSPEQTFGSPFYTSNRERLQRLAQMSREDLLFLIDVERQLMGNPDKYLRAA